jgi:CRISPR-associated endoribonuclease Cas6
MIEGADAQFAHQLHNQGLKVPNSFKTFKHFTFSSLQISGARPIKKGDTYIQLSASSISLVVSFYMDSTAEHFITGLFQNQTMSLYNSETQADFVVERVESLPMPIVFEQDNKAKATLTLKTISPMVVAKKNDGTDQYLSPIDEEFASFFALNLIDRSRSLAESDVMKMDLVAAQSLVKFKLLTDPTHIKKRGFVVKEGKTDRQTKVIGYHNFSFEITAPVKLIELGFLGGFGRESSMGCGCVEVV